MMKTMVRRKNPTMIELVATFSSNSSSSALSRSSSSDAVSFPLELFPFDPTASIVASVSFEFKLIMFKTELLYANRLAREMNPEVQTNKTRKDRNLILLEAISSFTSSFDSLLLNLFQFEMDP